MKETTINFQPELVKRLNGAMATASAAVAEAALSAVAQDKRVTVRTFATALRDAAPMLGTNNAVLTAAIKAAKVDKATLNDVAEAMAAALTKKRDDDRKRAADRAAAAPGKALQKAQAEVEECLLAMRSEIEVAQDALTAADAAVKAASAALREARAARRAAQAELEAAEYTGSAAGEMVTVKMNGKHEVLSITIKPEVVDPDDIEMLEDMVAAAINATVKQVDETAEAEMGKLTGGLNIPGL